ncbi:MAG: DUF1559 domain-containing protein [Pirellulales bacterium]|nr:DUF1559 domain-containing protein [Pirellulales bacterium]
MQFTLTSLLALCVYAMTSLALFGPAVGVWAILSTLGLLVILGSDTGSCLEFVVVFAVILILVAMMQPAIVSQGHERGRLSCAFQLQKIAEALRAYHADHGCFPPACVRDANGKPMHSWRVLILPYLDHEDLRKAYRMDEPWDSPHNQTLIPSIPEEYECWRECLESNSKPGVATYVAVMGDETVWPKDRRVRMDDVVDGLDKTILLVEASADLAIPWTEPRDISLDDVVAGTSSRPDSGPPPGLDGPHSLLLGVTADGAARGFPRDTSAEKLRALLTVAGGEPIEVPRSAFGDPSSDKRPPSETGISSISRFFLVILWIASLSIMITSVLGCRNARLAAAQASAEQTEKPQEG